MNKKIIIIFFLTISSACWAMKENDDLNELFEQFQQLWNSNQDTSPALEQINTIKKIYEQNNSLTEDHKKKIPVIIVFSDGNKRWYPFSTIEKAATLKNLTDDAGLTIDFQSLSITEKLLDVIFAYLQNLDEGLKANLTLITQNSFEKVDFSHCIRALGIINYLEVNSKNFNTQAIIATLFKYALSKPLQATEIENNEGLNKLGSIKRTVNIMLAHSNEELKLSKPKTKPRTKTPKMRFMTSPSDRNKERIYNAYFDPHTRFLATQRTPYKVNIWDDKGEWVVHIDIASPTTRIILTGEKDNLIVGINTPNTYKITKLIHQKSIYYEEQWKREHPYPVSTYGDQYIISTAFDADKGLFGLSAIDNKKAQEEKNYYLRIGSYKEKSDSFTQMSGKNSGLMSINFISGSDSVLCATIDALDLASSNIPETIISDYKVRILNYKTKEDVEYEKILPYANLASHLKNIIALNKDNICAFGSKKDIHITPLKINLDKCSFMEPHLLENAHEQDITSLMFHPTEPLLVSCSQSDKTIKIWNIKDHYCTGIIVHNEEPQKIIGFTTSNNQLKNAVYEIYVQTDKTIFKDTVYCSKGLTPKQSSGFVCSMQAIKDKKDLDKSLEELSANIPDNYKEYLTKIKLQKNPTTNPLNQSWLSAWMGNTLNWIKQKLSNPWVSVPLATGAIISSYALWNRSRKGLLKD